MHVNAPKFLSCKQNRGKIKSAELKREVEQGSTFTLTSDLSCIASILFANVNFTHVKITRHWKSTLSVYLHVETICPQIWAEPLGKNAKTEKKILLADVRCPRTPLLKLRNISSYPFPFKHHETQA